jgi:hypothetical protein
MQVHDAARSRDPLSIARIPSDDAEDVLTPENSSFRISRSVRANHRGLSVRAQRAIRLARSDRRLQVIAPLGFDAHQSARQAARRS